MAKKTVEQGTDFSLVSNNDLYALQEAINNRPLKVLGYKTPNEAWAELTCQLVH